MTDSTDKLHSPQGRSTGTDELRAAAERYRDDKYIDQPVLRYVSLAKRKDAASLARAYLTEHPAEDYGPDGTPLPATPECIAEFGFYFFSGRWIFQRDIADEEPQFLYFNVEGLWLQDAHDGSLIQLYSNPTRPQLRQLVAALAPKGE